MRHSRSCARVKRLKADLQAEHLTGPEAKRELRELQIQLERLRKKIEEKKVIVAPAKIHTQSQTTTFDLGPERLLVITADNLRVEGWEGPGVKCVLEKTVLATGEDTVIEHFEGLKVIHRHGPARNLVGRTDGYLVSGTVDPVIHSASTAV